MIDSVGVVEVVAFGIEMYIKGMSHGGAGVDMINTSEAVTAVDSGMSKEVVGAIMLAVGVVVGCVLFYVARYKYNKKEKKDNDVEMNDMLYEDVVCEDAVVDKLVSMTDVQFVTSKLDEEDDLDKLADAAARDIIFRDRVLERLNSLREILRRDATMDASEKDDMMRKVDRMDGLARQLFRRKAHKSRVDKDCEVYRDNRENIMKEIKNAVAQGMEVILKWEVRKEDSNEMMYKNDVKPSIKVVRALRIFDREGGDWTNMELSIKGSTIAHVKNLVMGLDNMYMKLSVYVMDKRKSMREENMYKEGYDMDEV